MAVKKATRKPKGAQLDPSFEGALEMSGAEFHSFRNMAVRYYYETYKISDLIKDLYLWMKDIGYKADQIRDIKTVGADGLSASVIYAVCLRKGMPDMHPAHNEYWNSLEGTVGDLRPVSESIKENIDKVLSKVRPAVDENATVEDKKPQRSVQDYMRDKAATIGGYVEQVIDDFVEGDYKNPEKLV